MGGFFFEFESVRTASSDRDSPRRDETIADKEKRIFDLKKKNQELEKFKFVLDYKIKELKKQIEPREVGDRPVVPGRRRGVTGPRCAHRWRSWR